MSLDNQSPELFGQTPWQTVGPFFHYGLPWKGGADLIGQSDLGARPELMPDEHYLLAASQPKGEIAGQIIEIVGRVTDAENQPLPDALLEIWQADSAGRHDPSGNCGFIGFGRSSTSDTGEYHFRTVLPGRTAGPGDSLQAPHIAVSVFGRGLLKRLVTRLYFEGEASNAEDPILALVPDDRRDTLMARPVAGSPGIWRFDIVLQGEHETVFFDI